MAVSNKTLFTQTCGWQDVAQGLALASSYIIPANT